MTAPFVCISHLLNQFISDCFHYFLIVVQICTLKFSIHHVFLYLYGSIKFVSLVIYWQAFKYLKTALKSVLNLLFFKLNIFNCFICSSYYLVTTPSMKYCAVVAQSFKKSKKHKQAILWGHIDYCETVIFGVIKRFLLYLSKVNIITT